MRCADEALARINGASDCAAALLTFGARGSAATFAARTTVAVATATTAPARPILTTAGIAAIRSAPIGIALLGLSVTGTIEIAVATTAATAATTTLLITATTGVGGGFGFGGSRRAAKETLQPADETAGLGRCGFDGARGARAALTDFAGIARGAGSPRFAGASSTRFTGSPRLIVRRFTAVFTSGLVATGAERWAIFALTAGRLRGGGGSFPLLRRMFDLRGREDFDFRFRLFSFGGNVGDRLGSGCHGGLPSCHGRNWFWLFDDDDRCLRSRRFFAGERILVFALRLNHFDRGGRVGGRRGGKSSRGGCLAVSFPAG